MAIAIWQLAYAILCLLLFRLTEAYRPSLSRPTYTQQIQRLHSLFAIEPLLTTDEFEAVTSKTVSKIPSVIDFQKSGCKPCIKVKRPWFNNIPKFPNMTYCLLDIC